MIPLEGDWKPRGRQPGRLGAGPLCPSGPKGTAFPRRPSRALPGRCLKGASHYCNPIQKPRRGVEPFGKHTRGPSSTSAHAPARRARVQYCG